MKRFFLFFLPVLATVLVSCEGKNICSHTPELYVDSYIVRSSTAGVRDTLSSFNDTTIVGDTLRIGMLADAFCNNLLSIKVDVDTNKVKVLMAWKDEDKTLLAADAKPEQGLLTFKSGLSAVKTTLTYIPRKAGDYKVSITLSSDALAEHTPRTWSFNAVAK